MVKLKRVYDPVSRTDGTRFLVEGESYCVIDLELARAPQTLLAYDMNSQPLPTAFGAPLRLGVENQLGYKMVKWVSRDEVPTAFAHRPESASAAPTASPADGRTWS